MKQSLRKVISFAGLLFITATAYGQGSTTSSISGKIVDENNEGLPGATVLAIHTPSGSEYGSVTDVSGFFRINNMRVGGPYEIRVTYVGHEPYVKTGVMLNLGKTFDLNAQLSETVTELEGVTVTADPSSILNSERTGAQTTISTQELTSLPNASRSINDFTRLTPQASFTSGGGISIAGMNNRYNSIFIDGAVSNDVFGLAANGQNGGQLGGLSLISIDALDQISVAVAPYDVTLGGFAGAGISAVTRSGTNEVEGSVYYLVRNEDLAGKTPTLVREEDRERLAEFSAKTYGFRLGGPVIKDKLFFFINGEIQRDETPQPFDFNTYTGSVTRAQLDEFANTLRGFGYEPGGYEDVIQKLEAEKLLVKFDYNLSENHKLSLRHSYNKGENFSPSSSNSSRIRFANAGVFFPSTTNATTLEFVSNFNNMSNKFIAGYTSVNDDRDPLGDPFPYIDIRTGDIEAGSEQFSTGNLLEQKIFTLTNNFNLYKGKHTFTFGTHNEFYDMRNVFIRQNFGAYRYNTIQDFLDDANNASDLATQYDRSYSLVDNTTGDQTGAAADFKAMQLGFYVQDEIQVNDKLKVTAGLRVDIPTFTDDPVEDTYFNNTTVDLIQAAGYDLKGARAGEAPDTQFLFAPRFGFNYDVKGDQSTQLRGGIGVFTSRVPFVWPGAMYNNNGLTVGGTRQRANIDFNPDPFNQPTVGDFGGTDDIPQGQMDLFAEDFKFPQVARASIAVDQKLPFWGLIGTAEAMYTKTINNIYYENVNVAPPTERFSGTPDNRLLFTNGRVDNTYTGIYLGSNTNEGYSYNLTASLTKPFENGLTANLAYNFGRAEAIFEGTSSQNSSQWRGVYSINGRNNASLGRSDFDAASRVIASVSYRKEYLNFFATTIGLYYQGQSGTPFSYTYDAGFTGEDSRERALIYVPANASEIVFDESDVSAEAQWNALNAYIAGDEYLSERRGQYAEKNMARTPFESIIDFKLLQDVYIMTGGKRQTLQISFDIFNFGNFLYKDWGRRYGVPNGGGTAVQLLNFEGLQPGTNTPVFTFNTDVKEKEDFLIKDDSGLFSSRWQMQLGLRYIFGN